jgi:hypothetical protein
MGRGLRDARTLRCLSRIRELQYCDQDADDEKPENGGFDDARCSRAACRKHRDRKFLVTLAYDPGLQVPLEIHTNIVRQELHRTRGCRDNSANFTHCADNSTSVRAMGAKRAQSHGACQLATVV